VIAEALYAAPVSPVDATRNPRDGGLPECLGFYAWWHVPGSLPAVPSHPSDRTKLDLLYVGIAPNSATSKQTVRSRVVGNHLGGNTGSSTFRYSLAALLMDVQKFQPTRLKDRIGIRHRGIALPRQPDRAAVTGCGVKAAVRSPRISSQPPTAIARWVALLTVRVR
jgi:hypothetical protein